MGYQIVAAIDFGTTFSGYAYSFSTNKDAIYVNKNWGQDQGFQLYKNPTCVLLKQNGQFEAFGFDAVSRYSELSEDDAEGYLFFDCFKMKLYDNKNLNTEVQIKASNGKSHPAVDVFAHSLRFMKDHMMKAIEDQLGYEPNPNNIQWVLTVPAIWQENAKQFMREAAHRGGLIPNTSSKQLIMALEPEVASLHCRRMPTSAFVGHGDTSESSHPSFATGHKHLIVDAGGGTVDCVVHAIDKESKMREIVQATGGPWGGTVVDREFEDLLTRIFGKGFMDKFKRCYPKEYVELMQDFEIKKRGKRGDIRVSLPNDFCNFSYNDVHVKEAIANYSLKNNNEIKFSSGKLVLTNTTLNGLFDHALREIMRHIEMLLRQPNTGDLDHLFLVGGFADSSRLQNTLKEHFGRRITCHVPEEASLAVVRGAVAFGHDTSAISQRICRFTYGCNRTPPFKEGEHREDLKIMLDGEARCKNIFQTWVEAGDAVSHNHKWQGTRLPLRTGQTAVDFSFYRSTRKNIKYIDEPGMERCGYLRVQMPDLTGEKNRKVDMEVIFGGTEIKISARDRTSGNECETTIDFLAV